MDHAELLLSTHSHFVVAVVETIVNVVLCILHPSIRPFIHPSIHSFIHSFIQSSALQRSPAALAMACLMISARRGPVRVVMPMMCTLTLLVLMMMMTNLSLQKMHYVAAKVVVEGSSGTNPHEAVCETCHALHFIAREKLGKKSVKPSESDIVEVLDGVCDKMDNWLRFNFIPPEMMSACRTFMAGVSKFHDGDSDANFEEVMAALGLKRSEEKLCGKACAPAQGYSFKEPAEHKDEEDARRNNKKTKKPKKKKKQKKPEDEL